MEDNFWNIAKLKSEENETESELDLNNLNNDKFIEELKERKELLETKVKEEEFRKKKNQIIIEELLNKIK